MHRLLTKLKPIQKNDRISEEPWSRRTHDDDGKEWFVVQGPIEYWEHKDHAEPTYAVPGGTATDFASVPRIFWAIIPPQGRYNRASVVHDYLIRERVTTRDRADYVFLDIMRLCEVRPWRRWAMFLSVRFYTLVLLPLKPTWAKAKGIFKNKKGEKNDEEK